MEIRKNAGIFAAVTGVSAIVTAGYSWLTVAVGWCVGTVVLVLLSLWKGEKSGKLPALVILLGGIVIVAAAAAGAEDAFPEDTTFPFISAVLLLILWRAMCGERETPASTANVLGLILLPILAVLVVFGLKDVRWTQTLPRQYDWSQAMIAAAVTSPWWAFHGGAFTKKTWLWYGASAAISLGLCLLTHGILGANLVEHEAFPLYRAVQTIRILGMLQRLEALLAAGVLLGAFAVMLLMAENMRGALDVLLPGGKIFWKSGAVLLLAFVLETAVRWTGFDETWFGLTLFWGLVFVLALWIVFFGKMKNFAKKP